MDNKNENNEDVIEINETSATEERNISHRRSKKGNQLVGEERDA